MTSIVKKGKIIRDDLDLWDGVEKIASRRTQGGGTVAGLRLGENVDVLQCYGGGSEYTKHTIDQAIANIQSDKVTLVFNPGTWTIDADLTIAANFACRIPAGCVFDVASGKTLTFNGPVIQDHDTWTSGSGTVTINGVRTLYGNLQAAKILFTNAIAFGAATDTFLNEVSGDIYLSYGAYYNGANWIATQTTATIQKLAADGSQTRYLDTGLTVSNSFSPTAIFVISAAGVITTGSISAIDYSGSIITNKPQFVTNTNYPVMSTTEVDVCSVVSATTWESFGPTGSGADNVWSALDAVDTDADWIEISAYVYATNSSGTQAALSVAARPYGSSVGYTTDSRIASGNVVATGASAVTTGSMMTRKINVVNAMFDLYWTVTGADSQNFVMQLIGYGYN